MKRKNDFVELKFFESTFKIIWRENLKLKDLKNFNDYSKLINHQSKEIFN